MNSSVYMCAITVAVTRTFHQNYVLYLKAIDLIINFLFFVCDRYRLIYTFELANHLYDV